MMSLVARRAFLASVAGLAVATASTRVFGQAVPNPPVTIPYSPSTRSVSFPPAANDNLAPNQRLIANRTMTKVAIGMKSSGLTLGRTNRALRAVGKVLRVARVGGPWGFLAATAVGYGLEIILDGGLEHLFGDPEGPSGTVIPPGSNTTNAYMSYPYYSSILDIPTGTTVARNKAVDPTSISAYYRFDHPSSVLPPSSTAGGWTRSHTQNSVAPQTNRTTYTKAISSGQAQAGIVIELPNDPNILIPGFASTTAIPNAQADLMQRFLARKALADDAAANGSAAAFPGYALGDELPFAWPAEVPQQSPLTVGDWKTNWPSIPATVDPNTYPWELPQSDWDTLPTVNPDTGYSSNPNPGQSTDPEGNPLPIATGPEVEPSAVGELPGFRAFVDPFENLFNPFKTVFSTGDVACPPMTWPGWTYGGYGSAAPVTITYHCDMIEPFRTVIVAASTALGGWAAVSHIMEA